MLKIRVGGRIYSGWEEVSVTRSIESAVGSFSVKVAEKLPWPISPGADAVVELHGHRVLTGRVDKVSASIDAGSHSYKITGRDMASDLVDCSAMNSPGQFLRLTAGSIAFELARPFGISVLHPSEYVRPFDSFSIQQGETAWEAIERACRMRQLLAFSDARGTLIISEPGSARSETDLVEGINVLSASASVDMSERFRAYTIRGQSPGSDSWNGDDAAGAEGVAYDLGARRKRTLMIIAESAVDSESAQERAKWEATVRAARGSAVKVKVQGWLETPDGELWRPNRLVNASIPSIAVEGEFLISSVNYQNSELGSTTTLVLFRKDAFLIEPEIPADTSVGGAW